MADEILEDEDKSPITSKDLTRRRLSVLRAVIRVVLYECKNSNLDFSQQQLRDQLPDITAEELTTCNMICAFFLPYVCAREYLHNVALQVPFFLLCNNIFELSGYNSFCVSMGPLPGMNSLLSLQVDAPMLYSLFCISQTGRKMEILDLDVTIIENRAQSVESKDGVFSFFFDMRKIQTICEERGLSFAHNVFLAPGMKVLRINDHKKNSLPPNSVFRTKDKGKAKATDSPSKAKAPASLFKGKGIASSSKGKEKANVSSDRTLITTLEAEWKDLAEKEKAFLTQHSIRSLKKQWIKSDGNTALTLDSEVHNAGLYHEIVKAKATRNELNTNISQLKQLLQSKNSLYTNH